MRYNYSSINVDIDVFEEKSEIIKHLSNEELENELERRKKNNIVVKEKDELELIFYIDANKYNNDFFDSIPDYEIIDYIERQGYYVSERKPLTYVESSVITKEQLAISLKLRSWATKEQILNELEYVIN